MILVSPLVFVYVAFIYAIFLVGDLACVIGRILGHPFCNGSYASQIENMDDHSKLLGGVMVGVVPRGRTLLVPAPLSCKEWQMLECALWYYQYVGHSMGHS